MTQPKQLTLEEARLLVERLRGIDRVEAPPSLLKGVLTEIGPGDRYAFFDTPIGPLYVAYNDLGVSAVMRAADAPNFERSFRARFGRPIHRVAELPSALARALTQQINDGDSANLHFDLRGLSEFERAVLLKALEIPRGEVRPYSWIAREIGRPNAVRAVGTALGNNPVPLLIPCHRVVRTDGRIGDYIFGSQTKRAVLTAEGVEPDALEQIARAGVRYYADERDHTFCFPTCGGLYKRTNYHFLKFHSAHEALAAGFRPCESCRPAVGA